MRTLVVLGLALTGCTAQWPLSNEAIVQRIEYCESHHTRPARFVNFDGETVRIECRPLLEQ